MSQADYREMMKTLYGDSLRGSSKPAGGSISSPIIDKLDGAKGNYDFAASGVGMSPESGGPGLAGAVKTGAGIAAMSKGGFDPYTAGAMAGASFLEMMYQAQQEQKRRKDAADRQMLEVISRNVGDQQQGLDRMTNAFYRGLGV